MMYINLPDKPKTRRFFNGFEYRIARVVKWEYSYTFGKWGATVEFPNGDRMYTFPYPAKEVQVDS